MDARIFDVYKRMIIYYDYDKKKNVFNILIEKKF